MAQNLPATPRRQAYPSTRISLLEEVREAKNADAWRAFVDRYTPLVYGYCRQQRLQESDACDVTQNVFFAVSRAMRSFEYDRDRGRFRSWLGTITCREIRRYRSWVNRLRNTTVNAELQISEPDQAVADLDRCFSELDLESEWETAFMAHLYHQALRDIRPTFAPDVWQAFELTWVKDEAPTDAARQLERPTAGVYKAKFKVLKRLREEVETLADDLPVRPKWRQRSCDSSQAYERGSVQLQVANGNT